MCSTALTAVRAAAEGYRDEGATFAYVVLDAAVGEIEAALRSGPDPLTVRPSEAWSRIVAACGDVVDADPSEIAALVESAFARMVEGDDNAEEAARLCDEARLFRRCIEAALGADHRDLSAEGLALAFGNLVAALRARVESDREALRSFGDGLRAALGEPATCDTTQAVRDLVADHALLKAANEGYSAQVPALKEAVEALERRITEGIDERDAEIARLNAELDAMAQRAVMTTVGPFHFEPYDGEEGEEIDAEFADPVEAEAIKIEAAWRSIDAPTAFREHGGERVADVARELTGGEVDLDREAEEAGVGLARAVDPPAPVLEPPPAVLHGNVPDDWPGRGGPAAFVPPAELMREAAPKADARPSTAITLDQRMACIARLADGEASGDVARAVGLANGRFVNTVQIANKADVERVRYAAPESRGLVLEDIRARLADKARSGGGGVDED